MQIFTVLLLISVTLAATYSIQEDKNAVHSRQRRSIVDELNVEAKICYLRNDRWNEYYYAGQGFDDDRGRKGFLWIPGIRDNTGKFKITPVSNDSKFFLQTVQFNNEYLVKFNSDGAVRFQNNTATLWEIESVLCNKVKIASDGLYLGASGGLYDSERRNVVVKNAAFWNEIKEGGVETRADVWELYCV